MMKHLASPLPEQIRLTDGVLAPRIQQCLRVTIPAAMKKTVETGRLDAFDLKNYHGSRHIFWDSDVAKVLEGMAYALVLQPDPELQKSLEEWIDRIVGAQGKDGFLNSFFSEKAPEERWAQLNRNHQLYCAGHLMEAAAAAKDLPGGKKLLNAVCRYADLICDTFGNEPGKRRGWPGHEEIELALMKLYHSTGEKRYLKQAEYFIRDRGTEPNVFVEEGFPAWALWTKQAEKSVLEMTDAVGHAVQMVYLGAGLTDTAGETSDEELLHAAERIFENIRTRRMYVTGGIGSSFQYENFTRDYDLANGSLMYAESCAAMGLVQYALRLFNLTGKNEYLDVLELALYNGVLSGISLSGDRFFYTNYLEMDENTVFYNSGAPERQEWFKTSCCPTSFCRFLPQMGRFLYSVGSGEICVNIPAANHAVLNMGDQTVVLKVEGGYPYDGALRITLESAGSFALRFRIPGWCRSWKLALGKEEFAEPVIRRDWKIGDTVELNLDMPVEILRSNSRVTGNLGRIALKRGPVVYALEEKDQQVPVRELLLRIDRPIELSRQNAGLPEGTVLLRGEALREQLPDDELYTAAEPRYSEEYFTAIPYALWENRGRTNMCVWNRFYKDPSAIRDDRK